MKEELWINGYKMDLEENRISQTAQINDLAEIEDRQTSHTNRLKLPWTPNNIQALRYLGVIGSTSRIPYERVTVTYRVDGVELISKGVGQIKSTDDGYDLIAYSGNISLFNKLKGRRLSDLNYKDLDHFLTLSSYEESFSNTSGYIYGVANFGHLSFAGTALEITRQAPSVFQHTLWKKIFQEAGFTYSGDVFNLDDFKTEVIPPNRGYNVNEGSVSTTSLGDADTGNISKNLAFNNYTSFTDELDITGTIANTTLLNGKYLQIDFDGTLRLDIETDYDLSLGGSNFIAKINGQSIIDFALITGSGQTINRSVDVTVNDGDIISFEQFSYTEDTGDPRFNHRINFSSDTVVSLTSVTGEQFIEFSEIMPETSQIDFIKDVMQRYGLIFQPKGNNHYEFIRFETLANSKGNAEDWSDKLVSIGEEEYEIGDYAQRNYLKYQYEEDEPSTQDGYFDVTNENVQFEKDLITSIYKIPLVAEYFQLEPVYFVPLWNYDEDQEVVKNLETDIRVFRIKKINTTIVARFFGATNTSNITGDIPFLSLQNMSMQYFIGKNYQALNRLLNAPRKRSLYLFLTTIDMVNLDFFRLKYFKQLGKYYYLNKVSNFRSGSPVKCELIQINGGSIDGQSQNQPVSQLGLSEKYLDHNGVRRLSLQDFIDTVPPYFDPEYDAPEKIKIVSFGNSNTRITNNGTPILRAIELNANRLNLQIKDYGNNNAAHTIDFEFKIKSYGASTYSTVNGTIRAIVSEFVNQPPVADAGPNIVFQAEESGEPYNETIPVYGCNSSDPDGDTLTFSWQLLNAPPELTLTPNPTNPCYPSLTADYPTGIIRNETVTLQLTVTDTSGATDIDTTEILIKKTT